MKKVLLIKIESEYYSSIGMEEAFKEAFEEVRSIDWQHIRFLQWGNPGPRMEEVINYELSSFKPDLIFCQFQREILTIEQWQKMAANAFVINYTEDVREDITWYEAVAPHIGLTIFTNMDDCRKFWDKGLRAAYMMVSYNHLWYYPQPKTEKNYGDIIFIGNNFAGNETLNFPQADERVEMCKFMKEKFGDRFQAWGMGQSNQMINPALCREAYNNAKIVITQNNFKREGYCSDRALNAMACGVITIQQHFKGIEEMFKDAPDRFAWHDFKELYGFCEAILQTQQSFGYPFEERYRERLAYYMKTHHNWHNRVKFIKGFIKLQMDNVNYLK